MKIKKSATLIVILIVLGVASFNGRSLAYSSTDYLSVPSLVKPLNIGTAVPVLPGLPASFRGIISDDTASRFKLLNTSNLSFNDFSGALKSIATLAINLFLIVIQVVAGILKALLPFLK